MGHSALSVVYVNSTSHFYSYAESRYSEGRGYNPSLTFSSLGGAFQSGANVRLGWQGFIYQKRFSLFLKCFVGMVEARLII
jgi:hypothetical protein